MLQYRGELPTSTADRGLLYSVLVLLCLYINVFSIIIFVLLGVGSLGWRGVTSSSQKGGEKNRVFCYCPIRGWQFVYIYIVYMWWKCFLCDTTFYLYYGSTFSVSVLLIYIWFVSIFWFCLLSFLVFWFFLLSVPFLVHCTFYYFGRLMRWHS